VREVRSGKAFTIGLPMGNPGGDPVRPELYNGFPAETTAGGMAKCGVDKIANHGIAGRGVLIDMARYRGKESLDPGETFGVEDLDAAAAQQRVEIESHDNLVIRTGWLKVFFDKGAEAFYADFAEPGLVFSPELVHWFREKEIVSHGRGGWARTGRGLTRSLTRSTRERAARGQPARDVDPHGITAPAGWRGPCGTDRGSPGAPRGNRLGRTACGERHDSAGFPCGGR
jgi:Putative cyclase